MASTAPVFYDLPYRRGVGGDGAPVRAPRLPSPAALVSRFGLDDRRLLSRRLVLLRLFMQLCILLGLFMHLCQSSECERGVSLLQGFPRDKAHTAGIPARCPEGGGGGGGAGARRLTRGAARPSEVVEVTVIQVILVNHLEGQTRLFQK